jgi:hypothetical protein
LSPLLAARNFARLSFVIRSIDNLFDSIFHTESFDELKLSKTIVP